MNLARQHFIQTIEAIRIGKKLQPNLPAKQIKLSKKNPNFKTIFLDLDETLIHCDEASTNYTVKLNFPIEGGGTIAVKLLLYRQESGSDPFARNSSNNSQHSLKLLSLQPVQHRMQMWS